ncbi:RNA N6-adenosine-methyltransferase mettl16-like [Liolophura sinensis]|uniref:RNA N6-adenosine-methyltransferase mettl16-like n=1 Tax=Liolophura sinensis TaxID=3198878 RepID=UPI003157F7F5
MALNKFMHPRNIYKKPPDFKQLAVDWPEFRKHVTQELNGKVTLDFKNADALRCLTKILLKKDFGLDVDMPLDRLIPTIPQRVNYILWLEDVLHESKLESGQPVRGIDIGSGASCVYPLLGCKMNNWHFLATEVDEENLVYARQNVEKNRFSEMITVQKVSPESVLAGVVTETSAPFDFCMCNPPFFADHMEAQGLTSRSDDRPDPRSSSMASCVEQIADGGEVAFVKKMIYESLELKDKIRIFTSMLGKKSSLVPLKNELRLLKVPKFSSTEFCQGKTMRWGIGWSYDETVVFPKSLFQEKKKDKPPLVYVIPETGPWQSYSVESVTQVITKHLQQLQVSAGRFLLSSGGVSVESVTEVITEHLQQLQIKCKKRKSNKQFQRLALCAVENTWSNQRRKRRALRKQTMEPSKGKPGEIAQTEGDNSSIQCKTDQNLSASISAEGTSEYVQVKEDAGTSINDNGKRKLENDDCHEAQNGNKTLCVNDKIATEGISNDEQNLDTKTKPDEQTAAKSADINTSEKSDMNSRTKEAFLFKCLLDIRQGESGEISLEMSWLEGENRESMHQVMQYLKNQLNHKA